MPYLAEDRSQAFFETKRKRQRQTITHPLCSHRLPGSGSYYFYFWLQNPYWELKGLKEGQDINFTHPLLQKLLAEYRLQLLYYGFELRVPI